MRRIALILLFCFFAGAGLFAQSNLERLKSLFPPAVERFKTYDPPQMEKVRVNDKDYHSLVAYYEIDLDTSFSIRLNDYGDEPEFIDQMIDQLNASQPFEDESEKWVTLEIAGYPSRLEVIKKYPSYAITTFVQEEEQSWMLTFSGNGMTEERALKLMNQLVNRLMDY